MTRHYSCPVCGGPVEVQHRPPRVGWWRFGPLSCPSCQARLLLVRRHPIQSPFKWLPLIFLPDLRPWLDTISPLAFPAAAVGVVLLIGVDTVHFMLNPYRLLIDPGQQRSSRRVAMRTLKKMPLLERPWTRSAREKEVERLIEGGMETTEDTE